jgi:hypothetical protein
MRIRRSDRQSVRGFTTVEVAIGGFLLAMVAGASVSVLRSGRDAFSRGALESAVRAQATASLDAIAERLTDCGVTTASLADKDSKGGPYLTVQRCLGANGNVTLWGPPFTIGLANCDSTYQSGGGQGETYEPQTYPNGGYDPNYTSPNNQLALWQNGQVELLGAGLINDGFSVELTGSLVKISVTVERAVKGKEPVRVTAVRTIHLAN